MKFLAKLFVTCFGIGLMPIMPGTVASIAALPIAVLFYHSIEWQLVILSVIAVVGLVSIYYYIIDARNHDPKEVVIDEVFGQLLTVFLAWDMLQYIAKKVSWASTCQLDFHLFILVCFVCFRLFDITKLWIIGMVDKNMKNYVGVMLDDALASVFASCASVAFFYIMCFLH